MNKIVVISGASAGVGRATAHEFARNGARIAILARDAESLAATRVELEQLGAAAVLDIPTDVADADAVEYAADRVERELGPIDVWVNVAMVTIYAPVHRISPEEFKRSTEVTYLGTVYGTMAALSRMRARNRGHIVQVGSALAYRAIPLQSAYCGAKFAIRGFTDSLRCELIHDKSRVHLTMVQLPAVNTPQFDWALNKMPKKVEPVPPIYQPEVVAHAIYYASNHRRREMFVGWPSIKTIWANKFAPGLLDRLAAEQAWRGEESEVPAEEDRPNNLFHPVPSKARTRGRFDYKSQDYSRAVWFDLHRAQVLTGLALLMATGLTLFHRVRTE